MEKTYPEIEPGILINLYIGDPQRLSCDIIALKEQLATEQKINEIHRARKAACVWTVNTGESMQKFLVSEADAIITDNVAM